MILVTVFFIAATLSLNAQDTAQVKNVIVADNKEFIENLIKKNIKYLNKEFHIVCDMKSYNWISIKWINDELDACEITGEISYTDKCGLAVGQVDLILVGDPDKKSVHSIDLKKKDAANAETDKITSHNLKNILLYMPRCEGTERVSNDYQLEWVDNTTVGKGLNMNRRIIE